MRPCYLDTFRSPNSGGDGSAAAHRACRSIPKSHRGRVAALSQIPGKFQSAALET
jgi:hypothetical protein